MLRSVRVKDYMNPKPATVHCDASIVNVINILLDTQVSGAPVVDENMTFIGYVSEKDCIHRVLEDSYYCEPSTRVSELMQQTVLTVLPEESIVDIAQSMQDNLLSDCPVVQDGKLVGLIKRGDILRALANELNVCY